METNGALDNFLKFYENFSVQDIALLKKVYHKDVVFIDPFHKVNGNEALFVYFKKMMERVSGCRIVVDQIVKSPGSASVTWQMFFCHPSLNGGKEICVDGISLIKFADKVTYHRDYFDSGQLLYRNIPFMRSIVKFIERRM